ncbi:MAG: hypothetical protein LIP08_03305 [Bacteroides sp.]|nr:hypothetical protein [Bacteroides sp.]
MIYIQKHIGFYNSQLLGDNYYTGTTLEDYHKGAYILLDEEQVAFYEVNPQGTPEEVFNKELTPIAEQLPSREQLLQEAFEQINQQVTKSILSGFTWKEIPVWLSQENQLNYKAAYDLAIQFNGKNQTLPVRFKFGTTTQPIYQEFTMLEEFTDFYTKMTGYIRECCRVGWEQKDQLTAMTDENLLNYWRREVGI